MFYTLLLNLIGEEGSKRMFYTPLLNVTGEEGRSIEVTYYVHNMLSF